MINPVSERRVGASLEPSATVTLSTRGSDPKTKQLVQSAATTVASAISGLKSSNVTVVVDGMSRRAHDSDDSFAGDDLYGEIAELEQINTNKILGEVPQGSTAAVTCDIDTSSSQQTSETYDKTKSLITEKRSQTESEENSQPAPQGTEPGALPNTGLSIAPTAAAPTATNSNEKSDTETQVFPGRMTEQVVKPAGHATVVSAVVRVPRSYFLNEFKAISPNAKDPDENALQAFAEPELGKLRKVVQNVVGMKSDESISLDMYWDNNTAMLMAASTESATSSAVTSMLSSHVKEVAVGVLALVSLFMVSTIVKKGSPAPPIPIEPEIKEVPRLVGGESLAGVVGNEHAMLDGMELDEDAVKAQQMVEQVATMVKEDPDAAANLVKRWMNRS
jgi:flagellar biosynthesis/type III secretory pathway M-ring protein FliF/YscJ